MGQRRCTPTMTATTVRATAMAMMPLLPPMATMLMTMAAVIQGQQLDDVKLTTTMGQQRCTLTMMAMNVMAESAMATAMLTATAKVTATPTAMATVMMLPLPPTATMSMKTTVAIQGQQLDNSNWTTTMG
jgi:hypothetical protein